jgi:hypothetical protein
MKWYALWGALPKKNGKSKKKKKSMICNFNFIRSRKKIFYQKRPNIVKLIIKPLKGNNIP